MKRDKIKKISLFLTVFGFLSGAVLLATGISKTVNPATVTLTLYQTDLFASQSATAATIFTNSTGTQVDIVNNPDAAFGEGGVPVGIYKRIKFTVGNIVSFTGPDPCGSSNTVVKTFPLDGNPSKADQVDLYFATSDDGGSGSAFRANGTSEYPFLLQNPIEVKSGVTNVVKLIFDTANTLACDNLSQQVLLRPDMKVVSTYIEPPLKCTKNFPQQFWFSTFEINNTLFDQQGGNTDPTMTSILQQTGVVTRWGTVTFNKPDTNGNGTAVITMNKTYDDQAMPGIAMNMHNLGNGSGGYFNPIGDLVDYTTMTINYTMTGGGHLIMYTVDGTQVQGYFSDDCSAYMGVDISSNKLNALSFGLKKPSSMASTFPPDAKFFAIGPAFSMQYDPSTQIWDFGFGPANTIISTSTSTEARDISFSWRTAIGSKPDYTTGTWSSAPAEEASADTGTVFQSPIVRTDGLVPEMASTKYMFSAFGSNKSLITAASTTATINRSTPLFAGMWINVDPSPSYSDINNNWIIGSMHALVYDTDSTWGNGNEVPQFGMVYGRLTIDGAARKYSGVYTFRDVFSGVIWPHSTTGTVELRTDCYAYDPVSNTGLPVTTPAASCTTTTGIQGITMPVFYLIGTDQDGNSETTKLVLDVTKKIIGVWDAPDSNGVPCNGTSANGCDPAPFAGAGIGIKVQ